MRADFLLSFSRVAFCSLCFIYLIIDLHIGYNCHNLSCISLNNREFKQCTKFRRNFDFPLWQKRIRMLSKSVNIRRIRIDVLTIRADTNNFFSGYEYCGICSIYTPKLINHIWHCVEEKQVETTKMSKQLGHWLMTCGTYMAIKYHITHFRSIIFEARLQKFFKTPRGQGAMKHGYCTAYAVFHTSYLNALVILVILQSKRGLTFKYFVLESKWGIFLLKWS